jgi:hypothetical protein
MKLFRVFIVSLSALLLAHGLAHAQLPTPSQIGLNAALIKLFGDNTAFTATTDVRILDEAQKEAVTLTMNFAMSGQLMRADVDMSQIKSKDVPAQMLAQLKQMGIEKVASIMRPDKRLSVVVYPGLLAYADVPMSAQDAIDFQKKFDISKASLGKETVAGHACEKTKVVVLGPNGERHEAVVWYAADLKKFPVQMQMGQKDSHVVLTYRDVRLAKPDAKLFEAPAGYTKYESMDKLMQAAMARMLGGK